MEIIFNCERIQPNDIEKKIIKGIIEKNKVKLLTKEGERIILSDKQGVVFFNKKDKDVEVIDFCITENITNI